MGVGPSCELWWIVKAVDSNLKFGRRRLLEKGYGNFEVQKGMNESDLAPEKDGKDRIDRNC